MLNKIKNKVSTIFRNFIGKKRLLNNKIVSEQLKSLYSIPIIIINFNQLYYLKQLVDFLIARGFENIVIVDNVSTYPPLLAYYQTIDSRVKIEFMSENLGHMVLFKNKYLQEKYCKGLFVLTDADIVPNKDLPKDFLQRMANELIANTATILKVGFALDIETIPNTYELKEKVIKWETQFWKYPKNTDSFWASVDTTFAIYPPIECIDIDDALSVDRKEFLRGIRIAGNYTAIHGGWYIDTKSPTEETLFYMRTVNNSSSWRIAEDGKHQSNEYDSFTNK